MPADRADGVAEPYHVQGAGELAQKIAHGAWVVFRHEFLGDVCDLGIWIEAVRAECAELDVIEEILLIPRKDLTVVFNAEMPPQFEQVQASISRAELDRWLERQLRPELPARATRGE